MRTWGCAALLLLATVSATAATIVINHVAVIDVKTGVVLSDRAVTIRDARILKVEPAHQFAAQANFVVVDATGKFLIPGLWDMHVHMFNNGSQRPANLWFLPFLVAEGVTGIREMWTNPDQVAQINAWRRDVASGELIGPRIGSAGTLVNGPNGTWATAPVVRNEAEARAFVRMEKAAGLDYVKVYTALSRESYFAIADESRKQGIPFAGHLPISVGAEEASAAGQQTIEHLTNMPESCSSREAEWLIKGKLTLEEKLSILDTYDESKCHALMVLMAKNSTWQVPTLVVAKKLDAAGFDEPLAREEMKFIPAVERAQWVDVAKKNTAQRMVEIDEVTRRRFAELKRRQWAAALKMVRDMRDAGVPMMAGTDVDNPFLFPGFSLHDELELFVTAGLTPREALQTATLNPAKFLNKLSDFGSIETGKMADLVLLDENPLSDIRNTRKIRGVILNGRYLDRAALDSILQQQAESAARN